MVDEPRERHPLFLTTKEVAELLRVKERKVYDLAAADDIPHRRLTGKLLFPRVELLAWLNGQNRNAADERPPVLTGSHDPLLDWAVRECGSGLATLFNGSLDGIAVFADRRAALTGMHLPEADGWNLQTVAACGFPDCVLLAWAVRTRGLLLSPQLVSAVEHVADLRGKRVVLRQPGAGSAAIFADVLTKAGLQPDDVVALAELARTENDAAAMVASGDADAALGIKSMAQRFQLGFLPLIDERFDLLVDRRAYFTEPVQRLVRFARTAAFQAKAATMGGYTLDAAGTVRWLSP